MKNYPCNTVKEFGEKLMSEMMTASIRFSMGGIGGCKKFNLDDFDKEFQPYILKYLEGKNDSLAIAFAAMKDKEDEILDKFRR